MICSLQDIRFELLARLCPNSTGADLKSVCTEAGMYAIRGRRKTVTEKVRSIDNEQASMTHKLNIARAKTSHRKLK
jgi:ATP-dependent 26S proteasome regulatory subunit